MNTENAYSNITCTNAFYICQDAAGAVIIRTRYPAPYGSATLRGKAATAFLDEVDLARACSNDPHAEARSIDNLCRAEIKRNERARA